MAGYWLGSLTPEEDKPIFFYDETINGHEEFSRRIQEIEEQNTENHQVLVFFTGRSAPKKNQIEGDDSELFSGTGSDYINRTSIHSKDSSKSNNDVVEGDGAAEDEELNARGWNPDCNLFESVIDYLRETSVPPKSGWLLRVGIGDSEAWKDPNNPFRLDDKIKLTNIPTLLVWNSMKKSSGRQAFDPESILIMFDD